MALSLACGLGAGVAMDKDDQQVGDSRSDADHRKASLVLSGLTLTLDSALEVFRQRRAADPALEVAHLKRARDILDATCHAIGSTEPDRWARIAQAWRLLSRDAAPPAGAPSVLLTPRIFSSREEISRSLRQLGHGGVACREHPVPVIATEPEQPRAQARAR